MLCAAGDLIQLFLRSFVINANCTDSVQTCHPVVISCSHLLYFSIFLFLCHFAPAYVGICHCIGLILKIFRGKHCNALVLDLL